MGGFLKGLAAALAAADVNSGGHSRQQPRHAHRAVHLNRALHHSTGTAAGTAYTPVPTGAVNSTCGCTTIYETITGEGVLYFPPAPATSSVVPITTTATIQPVPVVPTPNPTTCPTPGVYTIPATTLTLTETTTVCAATSVPVTPGVHTAGGSTLTVTEPTTVTVPYAAVETQNGTITSTIRLTTYVCPTAGTYTVGAQTTTVANATEWVYPVPVTYVPGTYTAPEITTTVTKTNVVVYCPFTSDTPALPSSSAPAPAPPSTTAAAETTPAPAPAPETTPAPAPAPETSSAPAPVTSVDNSPIQVSVDIPAIIEAPSSSSAPAASSTSSVAVSTPTYSAGSGTIGNTGNQWAIVYTPYTSDGQCTSEAQVYIDVALIALKGFKTLRTYSTDCSTLEHVGSAAKISGIKMILGVFISSTGLSAAQEQITEIVSWGQWEQVELISVGNEAVFNGYCSASELAGFISSAASAFKSAGYTGLITTAETLDVWQANAGVLCDVVDVVACNIHPFFNAAVDAAGAGAFVASQLDLVDNLCAGKTGINLETGWPSKGSCNGLACPGTSEQKTALASIKAAVGGKSCILSFANDLWKAAGPFGCETSWGAIDLF
ncbi:beta-glucosidase btgE [Phlyctema vagabunda]|uniref:Probable beta-glucosidase btgE n=1 Tax=Phlyctema vagabunda TaxID=108571 RepID=A0ABR4PNC4_9HELO